MDFEVFYKDLFLKSQKINQEISKEDGELFFQYMNLLCEWNQKMNLTAIIEPKDIILKHFIDSLTILPYIEQNNSILDIGTGAGFPGIPVCIKNKSVKMTLMDSLNKRIQFLQTVIEELSLSGIKAVHGRAEEASRQEIYREKFDVVTSRAVASLSILLEYMIPFTKVGGICICMKGSNITEEIENAKNALNELGAKIVAVDHFILPESDIERNIVVIKKEKQTNKKYPRKAGTPAKEPL